MRNILLRLRADLVNILFHDLGGQFLDIVQLVHVQLVWQRLTKCELSLQFVEVLLVALIRSVNQSHDLGKEVLSVVHDHFGRHEDFKVLLVLVQLRVVHSAHVRVSGLLRLQVQAQFLRANVS